MQKQETTILILEEIRTLVRELHPELRTQPEVTLDSVLDRDLGLDSLGRVELLSRIERKLQVRFPEKVLTTAETPRDILRSLSTLSTAVAEEVVRERVMPVAPSTAPGGTVRGALTLNEVVRQYAEEFPERPHIYIESFENAPEILTFSVLYDEACVIAAGLQQYNLDRGDTVALMLPTCREYFTVFFGVLLAGGVPVPLYPPTRPSQIEEHLRRHRTILSTALARVMVTSPEVRPIGRLLKTRIRSLKAVVTPGELKEHEREVQQVTCRGSDIAFLQYTSGSTGDPKGVILTHTNLLANIRAMGEVVRVEPEDTFVSWLPLYHDMGLIGAWLGSLYFGCRLVVMSPLSFLARPERWLWAIHRYKATLSASPNFGYELACSRISDEDLKGLDLSSWRMAFNGAEAVSPQTIERFIDRFEPYGFRRDSYAPVYGLAECSVGLTFPPPGRGPLVDRIGRESFSRGGVALPAEGEDCLSFVACGRPLPGHQVRVVDGSGRELPERQQGRLEFKGPSATSGYLRNPDKTRSLFRGEWLDTGDLAYIAEGDLYITGRVKDVIIRGGRNLYPSEYEEAIGELDGVRKGCVAVFGSRSRQDGIERVVVLAESRITEPEMQRDLERKIFDLGMGLMGMAPDEVHIVGPGSVLKTSSGKVRRSATRNFFERGMIGRRPLPVWLQLLHLTLAGIPPFFAAQGRRLVNMGYAAYCWTIGVLIAVPVLGLIILVPSAGTAWALAHGCARLLARLTGTRMTVQGSEQLDTPGANILVANHMSYLDAFVLTASMGKPCSFVAKVELAANPFVRMALTKLGTVFVERFDIEKSREDSKKLSELIAGGGRVLFFAEGTLQRMPGLLPFQMGAFTAAVEKNTGVVPIGLRGTRNKLRAGSWFPRRGDVEVRFAVPIRPDGRDWQAAIRLRNSVRTEILHLVGEPDLAEEFSSLSQLNIPRGAKTPHPKKS